MRLGGGATWQRTLALEGDKSLSHRALILAAMAQDTTRLRGLSSGADVMSTAGCLRSLGASIELQGEGRATVRGWGRSGPVEPAGPLDCGNSGTSLRLLSGLIASYPIFAILDGDASLRKRPQGRVLGPLASMGCRVMARGGDRFAPVVLRGGQLEGYLGAPDVASAQVKSCILLAGLGAGVEVRLTEKGHTRDHTENLLRGLGVPLVSDGLAIHLPAGPFGWDGFTYDVPGDPSSAAFLVAAAVMGARSRVRLEGVCLNPTRLGFFHILRRMGADITITETERRMGEPVGVIEAASSRLVATEVAPEEVPGAIDEFPLLAVVATAAEGTTVVRGAEELRVKESDRIASVVSELARLGARLSEARDGFSVHGGTPLRGAAVSCHHDHRLEMSLAVAALVASGSTELLDAGWAAISFPEFWDLYPGSLERLE
jgi:3-phosphoshikimate 1-carboxyvinyltransferase